MFIADLLFFRYSERYRVLHCGFVTNGPTESILKSSTRKGSALGTVRRIGLVVRCRICVRASCVGSLFLTALCVMMWWYFVFVQLRLVICLLSISSMIMAEKGTLSE